MKTIVQIVFVSSAVAFDCSAQPRTGEDLLLTNRINLRSSPSLGEKTVRGLVVKGGHMYFLAFPTAAQLVNAVLVKSDLLGRIEWTSELGDDEFEDMDVDHSGNCLVLSSPRSGTTRLRRFDPAGQMMAAPRSLPGVAKLVATGDGRVFVLTRSGRVQLLDSDVLPRISAIKPEDLIEAMIVPLDGGYIAIIDGREATICLLDPKSAASVVRVLDHPEVGRVKTMYKAEEGRGNGLHGRTVLLSAAYNGNIYCLLSGFRAEDGAPILVIDLKGHVTKLLRCAMTYSNGVAGAPMAMAVDSGLLFLLDSEGTVSVFQL